MHIHIQGTLSALSGNIECTFREHWPYYLWAQEALVGHIAAPRLIRAGVHTTEFLQILARLVVILGVLLRPEGVESASEGVESASEG
jgi:hypothetical protein